MELLGSANWWLPNWLDTSLPTLGVEVHRFRLSGPGRSYAAPHG